MTVSTTDLARAVLELNEFGRLDPATAGSLLTALERSGEDQADAAGSDALEDVKGDDRTGDALEPADDVPPDYDAFTLDELRAEADRRGLTKSGNKGELVDRLATDDRETQR